MTYTINENAKNVWIRDNADTMDLSVQTEAHSVYLENGRTLEQEVGKGTMVSNVVTVDSSMEKVVEGTYDGTYESCVLKGRSLVNLASEKTKTFTTSHFLNCKLSQELIRDKKYLLNWKITNNTIGAFNVRFLRTTDGARGGALTLDAPKVITIANDGFDAIEFFTNASAISQGLTATIDDITIVEYQEGMEDWNIPYFEGLCDVKMPILKNVGKNLWDNEIFEDCPIATVNGDGSVTLNGTLQNHWLFNYTIDKGTYRSSSIGEEEYIHLFWRGYDAFFRQDSPIVISQKVTRQGYVKSGTYNNVNIKLQLEEGSVATPIEPYKTSILTTPEEVVLRKVGGVCDSYDALTGEYVQRVGEVVLDGSEDWVANSTLNTTKTTFFYLPNPHIPSTWGRISAKWSRLPNNRFVSTSNRPSAVNQKLEWISGGDGATGMIQVLINTERLSTPDTSGFKEWLSQNPITVQYELETPITTTIEPSTVPFVYENGHVILESGYEGQSLLPTLEYQTVVNRTGQIQSIANTVQKQEKQITKLEQMLIQNIVEIDYNNTLLTLGLEINEVI